MALIEGNASSRTSVVIFEDLECGDCDTLRRMLDDVLLPRYAGRVAFEHRDFPLPKHTWARLAAVAARAIDACDPLLGAEFRRRILAERRAVSFDSLGAYVEAFARAHGLPRIDTAEEEHALAVEADYQEGVARGVVKTPTVFITGAPPLIERFTVDEVAAAIEGALGR